MPVKFNQYWTVDYDKTREYEKFIIGKYIPGINKLGIHVLAGWAVLIGGYSDHILEGISNDLELLEKAAELLTPGGVLVYATCSIESEENQQVLHRFLENQTRFHLTDCREYLPPEAHPLIKGKIFAPLPSDEIDGFFAARLTSAAESD